MSNKIWNLYKEKILNYYGYLDLAKYAYISDEVSEKLQKTPIEEIFVQIDFKEYKTLHERTKKFSEMLADSNNKVILGELGSGKTTFLKFMLYKKIDEKIIPVYWEWEELYSQITKGNDFLTILYDYVTEYIGNDFNSEAIDSFIKENRFVFLVDRFDKVDFPNCLSAIEKIINGHKESEKENPHGNYFVIALRIDNFTQEYFNFFKGKKFLHYKINPLNDKLIYNYIHNFITYIPTSDKLKSRDQISKLANDIMTQPSIKKLVENPFFLNLIISIYLPDGTLPPAKLNVYDKCVEMLLREWTKSLDDARIFEEQLYLPIATLADLMRETAFEYYNKFINKRSDEFGILSRSELKDTLIRIYKNLVTEEEMGDGEVDNAIEELFSYFKKNDIGVIIEKSNGLYGFSHIALLEYLTATYLQKKYSNFDTSLNFIFDTLKHPKFRIIEETIIFLVLLFGISTSTRFIDILARKLLHLYRKKDGEEKNNILILLAKLLKDSEKFSIENTGEILNALAVFKSNHPDNTEISRLIEDIYKFSRTVREEFLSLINRLKKEKENWINFSGKAAKWTGGKAKNMRGDLNSIDKESQKLEEIGILSGLKEKVKNVREQLELLEEILERYEELVHEDEINLEKYNLNEMMKEIIENLEKKFRKIDVEYAPNKFGEREINTDKARVEVIIEELIRNTEKHSETEERTIKIELSSDNEDNSKFIIHFKDRGRGIPKNEKKKIFDPFYSTDSKSIGFGLPKVKKLVESLDGKIEEVGEEQKGVYFKISLFMS